MKNELPLHFREKIDAFPHYKRISAYWLLRQIDSYPYVFWVKIGYRPKWFKPFWKTRGANFLELQVWVFEISIGMPWKRNYMLYNLSEYGNFNQLKKANSDIIKHANGIRFIIGNYPKISQDPSHAKARVKNS